MCEKEIGTFGLSMGAEILLEDRTANLVVRLIGGISTHRLKKMGFTDEEVLVLHSIYDEYMSMADRTVLNGLLVDEDDG